MKNIDGISKTPDSIDNLKGYEKYQISFVSFDKESHFEHIYQVFSSVVITEINILIRAMTDFHGCTLPSLLTNLETNLPFLLFLSFSSVQNRCTEAKRQSQHCDSHFPVYITDNYPFNSKVYAIYFSA